MVRVTSTHWAARRPEVSLALDVHSLSILGARRRDWDGRRRFICMKPQRDSQEKSGLIIRAAAVTGL